MSREVLARQRLGRAIASEALDLGHEHLGEHVHLVLLAHVVGHKPRDTLREAHGAHLLVLDVAAQRERDDPLVVIDRRPGLPRLLVLILLRGDEGALGVEQRQVQVHRWRRRAHHRGRRRHHLVADDATVEKVVKECIHRENLRALGENLPALRQVGLV